MTGKEKRSGRHECPRLALIRPAIDQQEWERRREAQVRLHALLAAVEAGTVHPVAVQSELVRLGEILGVGVADTLATYLRDEIGVAELAAVTWVAQRLPARQVVRTFARLAQDAHASLVLRVKAVHVLVAATDESLDTFEERLRQFGLLNDAVGVLLHQMGNASLLALVKQIGHPQSIPAALGAIILFQELAGDDLGGLLTQLASMSDPAAANLLLGLGVGGRTAEIRAQARRLLTRMLNRHISPPSEVFAWLYHPAYLGSFQRGRSLHVVWEYPNGQVQSAVFAVSPGRRPSGWQDWRLESVRLSVPVPLPIAAALIEVAQSRDSRAVVRVTFAQVQQWVRRLWGRLEAAPYGQRGRAALQTQPIQGFLEYWVLQGNLDGAVEEEPKKPFPSLAEAGGPAGLGEGGGMACLPRWVRAVCRELEHAPAMYRWSPKQTLAAETLWLACWQQARYRPPATPLLERTWAAATAHVCQALWGIRKTRQQTAQDFQVKPAQLSRYVRRLAATVGIQRGQGLISPL